MLFMPRGLAVTGVASQLPSSGVLTMRFPWHGLQKDVLT
jgi:hypothetical protein